MSTRVAFCITELDPGGAERALLEIVTRLDRAEWEPGVFCLGPETELAREFVSRGVPTVCLGAKGVWQLGVLFRLARELQTFRPALLQTFLFHANIAGRLAGWWAGVPIIISGLRVAERGKAWHVWIDRMTQRLVRWHVCVSEGVHRFAIESGLPPERLSVIPNGVDHERFAWATPEDLTPFGIPAGAWTLVSVGRLTEQKAHADLIRALAPSLRADRSMHLLIVGEGPLRNELLHLAQELEVSQQVHLPGRQSNIPGLLKASQAFALPSRWEGMPNSLLEALAANLPCVATDVEGVRELLEASKRSQLVPPGDLVALREAVDEIRRGTSPKGDETTQHVTSEMVTWTLVASKYAALYARTLAAGSNPGV